MSTRGFFIALLSRSNSFVYSWGYLGLFLFSLVESASIFLPFAGLPLIFTFGSILNPFLVALAYSTGATLGSFTSYMIGAGGKELIEKKYGRGIDKVRKSFDEKGALWILIVMLVPMLPDNLMCAFLGMIRYDLKKYFMFVFIGKFIVHMIIAYSGYYSINWVLKVLEISPIP
jgi:membrane protein YqaA with SNARE-associated domain